MGPLCKFTESTKKLLSLMLFEHQKISGIDYLLELIDNHESVMAQKEAMRKEAERFQKEGERKMDQNMLVEAIGYFNANIKINPSKSLLKLPYLKKGECL